MGISGRQGATRFGRVLAGLMAGTALVTLAGAGQAMAQEAAVSSATVDIRAQPLSRALIDFSRQTGIEVFVSSEDAAGKQAPAVSGALSPDMALQRLLAGSGLSYRFTNPTTVTIGGGATGAQAPASDGSLVLDTIDVMGGRGGVDGSFTPDTPYETAGSVSHISRDEIDRLPPTSPGDMFINAPGVLNAGSRVGNSIDPNIRGLQGMGRVNTTVDGALNASTSYRGYAGNRQETYVDPDMIGGIDITKGPSATAGGGAIGGSVAMRTLAAEDIVKDGDNWAIRMRGGIGSNTVEPPFKEPPPAPNVKRDEDRPSLFNGDSMTGSLAAATLQDNFEGVFAISKRTQGNYFAGENNVPDGFVFSDGTTFVPGRNATIRPGREVYNTSEDTESLLLKGKLKWDDGRSFELGYMRFDSIAGEEDEALINAPANVGQLNLSHTVLNSYTARYRHESDENPYVNLRANLWHTDLDHHRGQSFPIGIRDHAMATTGGDISNSALIDTNFGAWTLNGGAEFLHEDAEAPFQLDNFGQTSRGPNGTRLLASAFSSATFAPTEWVDLSAGLRFDHYEAEGTDNAAEFSDRSGSRLSPSFGAVVKPLEGVQLFAQYKEGFRAPTLRELYWEIAGLQVNPDLGAETSKGWEFGANVMREDVLTAGDTLGFKATYFRNRYDNYVISGSVGPDSSNLHYMNIDRANYNGIELSGRYDSGAFFAEGSFTKYLEAEYCTAPGVCSIPTMDAVLGGQTPAVYVPPDWSGSVTAGVRLFDDALTIGGRAHFASTRIGAKWPPENPVLGGGLIGLNYTWPEYVVFDMFGSYAFNEDTMLNFSIENITDQYYYAPLSTTGIPSPGRTVRASLTHRFGGAGFFMNVPELGELGRASIGAPGDDWTGLYVGGHVGFAGSDTSGTITTLSGGAVATTEQPDYSVDGGTVGAQIGYNWQFANRVVLGVEADFSWLDQTSGKSRTMATDAGYTDQIQSETEYELDWQASLRGRFGYSFGRLMLYGTGGAGWLKQSGERTQYRQSFVSDDTEPYFSETDSATTLGWIGGLGAEYALTNNWTLKGEYAYSKFGTTFGFDNAREGVTRDRTVVVGQECYPEYDFCEDIYGTIPGTTNNVEGREAKVDNDFHMFKVGLNYRF